MSESENINVHLADGDRERVAGAQAVTIGATVAVWMRPDENPTRLIEKTPGEIMDALTFYGRPEREKFCDWVRIGEADITVRLIPRDEQVALAVKALQEQLNQARAEWLTKQQAILAQINSLQALTMDAA